MKMPQKKTKENAKDCSCSGRRKQREVESAARKVSEWTAKRSE